MILFLTLFFGCGDPAAPALAACDVVPMVSMDEASLTKLEPFIDPVELQIIKDGAPTQGFQTLGPAGIVKIREATSCKVTGTESTKEGTLVKLERTNPTVGPDGSLGEPQTVAIEYLVVSTDAGPRAQVGMVKAADLRAQIDKANMDGKLKRAAELQQSLVTTTQDPTLAVDVAFANKLLQKAYMLESIVARFDRPFVAEKEGEVNSAVAKISNPTQRDIQDAVVTFSFDIGTDKPHVERAKTGPIKAGANLEVMAPIPLEVKGGAVEVRLEDVTL